MLFRSHLDFTYLENALKEYKPLGTLAENPEKPERKSEEDRFFTPPESPQPETPRPRVRELPSEKSIPQHRTLTPSKSALKVKFTQ